MKPGIFSLNGSNMPVIHLKSSFIAIKEKYVGQPITKNIKQLMYQEFDILFERFELKDLQIYIKQNFDNSFEIIPVRAIDKWALRGILLTDEIE